MQFQVDSCFGRSTTMQLPQCVTPSLGQLLVHFFLKKKKHLRASMEIGGYGPSIARSMHGEMRCRILLRSLIWVGDFKTNFETFGTAVLMLLIQGWRCRPVVRCVDPLPDGMVDLIFDPMRIRRYLFNSSSLEFRWNSTGQT